MLDSEISQISTDQKVYLSHVTGAKEKIKCLQK